MRENWGALIKAGKHEMTEIRKELPRDYQLVRAINKEAFGQETEGAIVYKIRTACSDTLALVALKDGIIVGHIFFSPVILSGEDGIYSGMGLAPMAVLPDYQNQGVGSLLVNEGLRLLKEMRVPFVVVLGHPNYYPRFGFETASQYGLKSQWEGVPDDAFMVLFLDESVKEKLRGVVKYRPEFDEALELT